MEGMEELAHEHYVRLLSFGRSRSMVLWHTGTGEHTLVDGRWALGFADGFAYLSPLSEGCDDRGGQGARWVRELLTSTVVRRADVDDDDAHILKRGSGDLDSTASLLHAVCGKPFEASAPDMVFKAEIYSHALPKPIGDDSPGFSGEWWAIPWPLHYMTKGVVVPNNRWGGALR